jgi:hypothetical protein
MGLLFIIATGPCHNIHSHVRVPRDSLAHFIVSDLRLPQPRGPGPRIYTPQEHGSPVIPPGTGSLFVASYDSKALSHPQSSLI